MKVGRIGSTRAPLGGRAANNFRNQDVNSGDVAVLQSGEDCHGPRLGPSW